MALLDDPKKVLNFTAAFDPTAFDDKSKSFIVGTKWFNSTTGELFVCKADAVGAAVWKPTVPLGGLKTHGFSGRNLAGACTLTGAVVGEKIITIFEATGATANSVPLFESTITVADQIQQLSATDLSTKKYIVMRGT